MCTVTMHHDNARILVTMNRDEMHTKFEQVLPVSKMDNEYRKKERNIEMHEFDAVLKGITLEF